MSIVNEQTLLWPQPPAAGSEVETLVGSLERQRRTFAWKCGGLDAVGISSDGWRAEDTPEQLYALWEETVARARANLVLALADGDPGLPTQLTWPDGQTPSIRRLLVDVIEEYARHTGHADFLREAVDGLVGEDPPQL